MKRQQTRDRQDSQFQEWYAKALRQAREVAGINQTQMAAELTITRGSLSNMEKGRATIDRRTVYAAFFVAYAYALEEAGKLGGLDSYIREILNRRPPDPEETKKPTPRPARTKSDEGLDRMIDSTRTHKEKLWDEIGEEDVSTYWQELLDWWKTQRTATGERMMANTMGANRKTTPAYRYTLLQACAQEIDRLVADEEE